MKKSVAFVVAGITLVLGGLSLQLAGHQAPAYADDPPPNDASFELDVDTTVGGIQTTRSVATGTSFNVEVSTNTTDSLPWEGYQMTLDYNDVTLDGVVPGVDPGWETAPVEGVNGGDVFNAGFTTGRSCIPATQGGGRFLEDDSGTANWAVTCTETTSGTTHTGEGALIQFAFTCENDGTADFSIRGVADTFLLDNAFTLLTTTCTTRRWTVARASMTRRRRRIRR